MSTRPGSAQPRLRSFALRSSLTCMSAIAVSMLSACGPKNEATPPERPVVNLGQPSSGSSGASTTAPSSPTDRLKAALDTDVSAEKNPYPEGTRVLSVKLDGDTAIIDLSSEFKKLGNLGSQGESDAQSALIKCLAKSPEVQKMRVLVEGKLYEGEHSGEWDAIPVRDKVAGGA